MREGLAFARLTCVHGDMAFQPQTMYPRKHCDETLAAVDSRLYRACLRTVNMDCLEISYKSVFVQQNPRMVCTDRKFTVCTTKSADGPNLYFAHTYYCTCNIYMYYSSQTYMYMYIVHVCMQICFHMRTVTCVCVCLCVCLH